MFQDPDCMWKFLKYKCLDSTKKLLSCQPSSKLEAWTLIQTQHRHSQAAAGIMWTMHETWSMDTKYNIGTDTSTPVSCEPARNLKHGPRYRNRTQHQHVNTIIVLKKWINWTEPQMSMSCRCWCPTLTRKMTQIFQRSLQSSLTMWITLKNPCKFENNFFETIYLILIQDANSLKESKAMEILIHNLQN